MGLSDRNKYAAKITTLIRQTDTMLIQRKQAPGASSTYPYLARERDTDGLTRPALRVKAVSHPGITRQHRPNEDSYLYTAVTRQVQPQTLQSVGLFLVADGMGGYSGGQYASLSVLQTVRSAIEADLIDPMIDSNGLKEKLIQAIQLANKQLYHENREGGNLRGTTITGAILVEQLSNTLMPSSYTAHVVNVGDSRTYWYSTLKGVIRVTRDHSLVEDLIALGAIAPEERYTHKNRNVIYRCLGEHETVTVDTFTIALQPHDRLLICSDGLWEMLHDAGLANLLTLQNSEPSVLTSHMLHAALNRGGHDNITAIVVTLPG